MSQKTFNIMTLIITKAIQNDTPNQKVDDKSDKNAVNKERKTR